MFQTRHKKAVTAADGCNVDKKAERERGTIERRKERPKGKVSEGYHRDVCKHGGGAGEQKGAHGSEQENLDLGSFASQR